MDIDEDKKEYEEEKEGFRDTVSDEEKPVEEEKLEELTEESVEEPKAEEISEEMAEEAEEKHEEIMEEKPEEKTGEKHEEEKPEEKSEEKTEERRGFFARLKKEKSRPEEEPVPEKKPEPKPELEKKPEPQKPREPRIRISRSEWYNKNYKKLLYVSFAMLAAFIFYIIVFSAVYGDIMHKDVTLTGGTIITVYTSQDVNIEELETALEARLGETVSVRTLEDITIRKQIAVVIETQAEFEQAETAIEELLSLELTSENSNIEMSGASLSQAFYRQLMIAIVIAFIFMAIVVFIIFKSFIPSLAVVLAAFTDIIGALVIANLFGFKISTAGIAAFLMLIGYSVDTDIMLTTKVLKRRGEAVLNTRIFGAAKTGLMMTITSFCAVLAGFFIAQSSVLKQIFFILSAGLFVDMLSTWLGNASILKWYCKKKKIS